MSDLVLLSRVQMRRLEPFFPRSRGLQRVDDRRVISGIIYVIRHGLQWKDGPRGYGPPKTLFCNGPLVVPLDADPAAGVSLLSVVGAWPPLDDVR